MNLSHEEKRQEVWFEKNLQPAIYSNLYVACAADSCALDILLAQK